MLALIQKNLIFVVIIGGILLLALVLWSIVPNFIQFPFKVIATTPTSNQQQVYPGEIIIQIKTDQKILKEKNIEISFSPPLGHPFQFVNTFPSDDIQLKILGNLQLNTIYTVEVKNEQGQQ